MYLDEIFQQDNAPAHVSAETKIFIAENVMKFWKIGLLSHQTSILSIILWIFLKTRVGRRHPSTEEELIEYTYEEFARIPDDYIKKLYDSIPRRLSAVLRRNGEPTKYWFEHLLISNNFYIYRFFRASLLNLLYAAFIFPSVVLSSLILKQYGKLKQIQLLVTFIWLAYSWVTSAYGLDWVLYCAGSTYNSRS